MMKDLITHGLTRDKVSEVLKASHSLSKSCCLTAFMIEEGALARSSLVNTFPLTSACPHRREVLAQARLAIASR
jgi:hypothetical protein